MRPQASTRNARVARARDALRTEMLCRARSSEKLPAATARGVRYLRAGIERASQDANSAAGLEGARHEK